MISESLSYLRSSEDWIRTVLIGGVLTLFGFLIVPSFLVIGYVLRVVRATTSGDEEPPVFDDWSEMLVDGLKGWVIAVVYSIVPAIIGVAMGMFGIAGALSGSDAGGVLGALLIILGVLVSLVLGLLAAYVIPAALANYAESDGQIGAGFAFGELRPILTSSQYATGWAMAFVVMIGAAIVAGLLNVVPFIGFVIGAFVTFYALVGAFYIIGHTWADLHPVEMRDEDAPRERPAV